MSKQDKEMTVDELKRNGNEREAKLIGTYKTANGVAEIKMTRTIAGTMTMLFCVGGRSQEIGIPEQLRLEHAIRDGAMVRM